jgi:hypothetical protein
VRDEFGDLGWKMHRTEPVPLFVAEIHASRARLVSDNLVRNTGRRTEYECPAAPDSTCLIFGDSYSMVMLKFLVESFRRTVFAHLPETVDFDVVESSRPDLVLSVLNERFLIKVPADATALPLARYQEIKREKGMIYERNIRRRTSVLVNVALNPFELPDK